jgi:hypothetical protein
MLKKRATSIALLLLLAAAAHAGIRGPGKYRGIVVFDRWDTCYIYDGAYLMYVAEKEKERLRSFEGRYVEVNAKQVIQPMNPGDARIVKFDLLSSDSPSLPPGLKHLRLTAEPEFEPGHEPRFALAFENQGGEDFTVSTSAIGPTLLGEKDDYDFFSPSDGKSTARITRCPLDFGKKCRHGPVTLTKPGGREQTVRGGYSFKVEGGRDLPANLLVRAGQTERIVISLDVPPGTYDFLFGCGGGVHESRGLASNIVSFQTVEGGATLLNNRSPGD